MRASYYIPEFGETEEDARELDGEFYGAHYARTAVAEDAWTHRDGWEWMTSEDTVFVLLLDGKEASRFTVAIETSPEFHCAEVKK